MALGHGRQQTPFTFFEPTPTPPNTGFLGKFVTNANNPQVADYALVAGLAVLFTCAVAGNTPRVPTNVTNANAPQIVAMDQVNGAGFVRKPTVGPQGQAIGSRSTFGAHAIALYNAEAQKSQVWRSAAPLPPASAVQRTQGAPQLVDLTLQPVYSKPLSAGPGILGAQFIVPGQVDLTQQPVYLRPIVAGPGILGARVSAAPQLADLTQQPSYFPTALNKQGAAVATQATFGAHAIALYNAEAAKTQVWKAIQSGTVAASSVSSYQVTLPVDPTQAQPQLWRSATAAPSGRITPFLYASPQAYDYSLQGSFSKPLTVPGWLLTTISAGPDPSEYSQPKASYSAPLGATALITGPTVRPYTAGPQLVDLTLQPSIWAAVATPPVTSGTALYTFGTHAVALYNAEAVKSRTWPSLIGTVAPTGPVPPYTQGAPQLVDLSQQPQVWTGSTFSPGNPIPPPDIVGSNPGGGGGGGKFKFSNEIRRGPDAAQLAGIAMAPATTVHLEANPAAKGPLIGITPDDDDDEEAILLILT